jgi:lactam utilization protein B
MKSLDENGRLERQSPVHYKETLMNLTQVQLSGAANSSYAFTAYQAGSRYTQFSGGEFQVTTKTPAEVAGERLLKPLIDAVAALFSSIDKAFSLPVVAAAHISKQEQIASLKSEMEQLAKRRDAVKGELTAKKRTSEFFASELSKKKEELAKLEALVKGDHSFKKAFDARKQDIGRLETIVTGIAAQMQKLLHELASLGIQYAEKAQTVKSLERNEL